MHYVEGCFTAGATITTIDGMKPVEKIRPNFRVLTHKGRYQAVSHIQKRRYTGKLFTIQYWGDSTKRIEVTQEHPILVVRRDRKNERNKVWEKEWTPVSELSKGDYLVMPINNRVISKIEIALEVDQWQGKKKGFVKVKKIVPSTPEFFRLVGYYLAEGSISSGSYLNFSFSEKEVELIEDVKTLMNKTFRIGKSHTNIHKKNHGVTLVFNSVGLCRIFEKFGTKNYLKNISPELLLEDIEKQKELILGWFRGDGNYFDHKNKHGRKEIFRINTTSRMLVFQGRNILLRCGIMSFINVRDRSKENRRTMYTLGITGEQMRKFGQIVGIAVDELMNDKKRATKFFIDKQYAYLPIREISSRSVRNVIVYNFGVDKDESYVVEGIAVHNCTAPAFSDGSLHSAVVEIFVKKGATVQYTTVQNWYKNVYNLVTKRARVEEEGRMVWTDFNMGSKVTMKYPGFILAGKGAVGETLSMAMAGAGQQLDTGSKAIHLAPYTSSTIISKSISKGGGRTSYRGMVSIGPKAHHSKSKIVCDALILDPQSRSDTYPTNKIFNSDVTLEHEASVSRIGEEQLFYLMSRGIPENEAGKMIVQGFADPLIKKLPMEYAVEMNRLIDMEMTGSVG